MTQRTQSRAGPPVGRHVAAVGLAASLTAALFFWFGGLLPLTHAVLADASLVLLCLILMLGALARFVPRLRPVVPWGRELGIAMFVTAGLHTAILIGPELDVVDWFDGLFPDQFRPTGQGNLWAGAQWLGLGALAYAAALAVTSNDWSQRFLGRGWKFVQRQAYTLFVLTWIHTAAFLFFGAGHGALLPVWLFWGLTGAVVVAQFSGFGHTVRARRPPSQHRVPPKPRPGDGDGVRGRATRWFAVIALWTLFVVVAWWLSILPSQEEAAEAAEVEVLCEKYNELGRPSAYGPARTELMPLLPPDWERSDLAETVEACPND